MVSQPKETPITEVHQGSTPAEYDGGFLGRVINDVNLVLRNTADEIAELSIPPSTVLRGGYDPTTDTCSDTGAALTNDPLTYLDGDRYVISDAGNMPADASLGGGAAVTVGDTIYFITDTESWLVVSDSADYLSKVNDDSAAGQITFEAKTWMQAALDMNQTQVLDLPNPSGNNSAARKRYVDDQDAAVRAYADDQDAAHVAHLDPHEQYVERTEAVATFVFAAYAGLQAPLPITGPATLDDTWTPLTFGMSTLPAIPLHMTVDAANGTIQPHYNGMYALALTVAFEHNSVNSGRTTRLRVYNITQDIGGAGVVIGTGRNAEATSGSFTILMHIVNDNDVFRMEIGGGDDYSQIDWDAIGFQLWSVGPFSGTLGSDTQYADIDVDALMAPALADVPSNDNAPIKAGVLRRLLTAIINILKQIESRHD